MVVWEFPCESRTLLDFSLGRSMAPCHHDICASMHIKSPIRKCRAFCYLAFNEIDHVKFLEVTVPVHPCTHGISISIYVNALASVVNSVWEFSLYVTILAHLWAHGINESLHVSRTLLDFSLGRSWFLGNCSSVPLMSYTHVRNAFTTLVHPYTSKIK